MSATPPAGYRFGAFWGPAPSEWWCTYVESNGDDCEARAAYSDGDDNGACEPHAEAIGAIVKSAPDDSDALREQLREAAAHVGELLAPMPETADAGKAAFDKAAKRNAARAWLTAYLAKGGA